MLCYVMLRYLNSLDLFLIYKLLSIYLFDHVDEYQLTAYSQSYLVLYMCLTENGTQNQHLACFVGYLKIINTFLLK